MADIIDDAQAYNELHQAVSLQNQRDKLAPETHPDFDGLHCVDCGEVIHPMRLAIRRVRCIECQTRIEKIAKLHAR